jgi:hypothetical protein
MALVDISTELTVLPQFCIRAGKQPYIKDSQYKNSFTSTGWQVNQKDWLTFSEALEATKKPAKVWHDGTMQPVDWYRLLDSQEQPGYEEAVGRGFGLLS